MLGALESQVVGGTVEADFQFPWVVSVSGNLTCHGTLIDDRWVLTAAHCVQNQFNGVTVSYSRTDPTTRAVTARSQMTGPGSTFVHPQWDPHNPTSGFDIALVRLRAAFLPDPMLRRAELPLVASGIGRSGVLASGSATPGTATVLRGPIVAGGVCLAAGNEFCVQSPAASVCPGDSGSGFITVAGGMNFVTGIAVNAADVSCTSVNKPFAATDVRPYLPWIRSNTGVTGGGYQAAPADYDNDGKMDIAVKFDSGDWRIDLAANGFGTWDLTYPGYGDASAIPVPGDYDGDGKTDLAIKNSLGEWNINFAADGFATGFNLFLTGYGDATAIPVPADYDGDGKADLAIKNSAGEWNINWAFDGFTTGFNLYLTGYGFSDAIPAPADYDGDRRADLSVRDSSGVWYMDWANDGFGVWNASRAGYGSGGRLVPADYDGDHKADWSLVAGGFWFIDYSSSPQDGWNVVLPITY
jgi:hypothetical protein